MAYIESKVQRVVPLTGETVTASGNNLILNPAGALAALTITLPANPVNKQIFSISSTAIITVLTLVSGVNTLLGGITTIAANSPVRWVFYEDDSTWYRI